MSASHPLKGKSKAAPSHPKRSGSPFCCWSGTEDHHPLPGQSVAYKQALTYFSASHPPAADRAYNPSLFVNAPDSIRLSIAGFSDTVGGGSEPQTPVKEIPPRIQIGPDSVDSRNYPSYTDDYWGTTVAEAPQRLTKIPETGTDFKATGDGKLLFPFGDQDDGAPVLGRTYRVLTGGDLCEAYVDVSSHRHTGHTSALKVRPAIGLNHFIASSYGSHSGHSGVPRVRPLTSLPPFEYPDHIMALLEPVRPTNGNMGKAGAGLDAASREVLLYPAPEAPRADESDQEHDFIIYHKEARTSTFLPLLERKSSADSLMTGNTFGSTRPDDEHDSLGLSPRWLAGAPHYGHIGVSKVESLRVGSDGIESTTHDVTHEDYWNPDGHSPLSEIQGGERGIDAVTVPSGQPDSEETTASAQHKTVTWSPQDEQGFIHEVKPQRLVGARSASHLVAYWESLEDNPAQKEETPIETPSHLETDVSSQKGEIVTAEHLPQESNDAEISGHNSRLSDPPKSGLRRTASWFRDLIRPSEPYKSKLTGFPERKLARKASAETRVQDQTGGTTISRRLTRNSTTPATPIDGKFKAAFSNFEDLLSKAMILTHEAVDQKDQHQCETRLELDQMKPCNTPHCPPSVHESLSSIGESSGNEHTLRRFHSRPVLRRVDDAGTSHGPKHYSSAPGMRSRNVAVNIPKRTSSLRKYKLDLGHATTTASRRNQSRDKHLSAASSDHRLKKERSISALREDEKEPESDSPPPSGCLPRVRKSRKSRSRHSLNSTKARNHPPEVDGPSGDKFARLGLWGSHIEGITPNLGPWRFDGANDELLERLLDHNMSQGTDGVQEPDEPRLQHPRPPPPASRDETGGHQLEDVAAQPSGSNRFNLRGKPHVSIRGYQGFSLARAYKRQPVARDWSTVRKRFVATVACLSTAMIGILIGIYAGMVPSIQYWIADLNHYANLGNVFFYLGLAIPTFFFWPLPLLHGRKPYILSSLVLAMPLLFPQAIAVSTWRSPFALVCSRAFMGLALGFASMNFHSILMDLFGASLMSGNPHQEVVDKYDVRRHGGGMGVWLGIWTWCFIGSLGIGFAVGAAIINTQNPAWGFYISIILTAVTLLLNVVCPEVRRSPFRRSVAEVRDGNRVSRRVARGECMMHRVKDGPTWWWEEVYHGILLSLEMLRQPGFIAIALYTGWIYAQMVLVIVLLGSLTSRYYRLQSPMVGLCVSFVSIGALVAVPFQKANIFSRARHHQQVTDRVLADGKIKWTSHLLRRAMFCIFLPLVGAGYTIVSVGPDMPVTVPVLFAALIGFFSGLAISECNGMIMETFDTSDLQPNMTGRPRRSSAKASKRTNYSSFPRVAAGFAICHTVGFILAAVATAIGGIAQRHLGQRVATGVVAGILFILSVLLVVVLARFKEVQIIPRSKALEMDKWTRLRSESINRLSGARVTGQSARARPTQNTMTDAEMWRPTLMGNPSEKMRRVNILELGSMTRWTEIRKKNKVIDETAAHLNRAAIGSAAAAFEEGIGTMTGDLVRRLSSRRSNRSVPRRFPRGDPGQSGATSSRGPDRDPTTGHADHGAAHHSGGEERDGVAAQTVPEERESLEFSDDVLSSDSEHMRMHLANSSDEGIPMGPMRGRAAHEYPRE